jgi:hypothetical protein
MVEGENDSFDANIIACDPFYDKAHTPTTPQHSNLTWSSQLSTESYDESDNSSQPNP